MPTSRGRFRAAVSVGWIVLASAAFVYARIKNIPAAPALLIAAAFLAEFPFYISPAFHSARIRNPWLLAASCILPWLLYSAPLGLITLPSALLLCAIALAVSFWYRIFPPSAATDLGFVMIMSAIVLGKAFTRIYLSPIPKLDLGTLGHVMLIRAGATAILSFRGFPHESPIEYRFFPTLAEWKIGLKWFAIGLPVLLIALYTLNLWTPRAHPNLPAAIPQFFGLLWVVALSEEFFFRGLLQQWFARWTRNPYVAIAIASAIFGAVHLGVHAFPNWRYSIVAALLGATCGLAFRESRTIQAGMVAHALAATLYRVFFE